MTIPFSKVSIGEEEQAAVAKVLASGWLAAGPETEAFEQEFASYIGVPTDDNLGFIERPYCIFTNSCTSALKIAYNILKEYGYEGIYYPDNTFVATYSAAAELGLDVCPIGGYDGDICLSQDTPALNADKSLKTNTIVHGESTALYSVIEKSEKDRGFLLEPSSEKGNVQVQRLNSKQFQEFRTQNIPTIGIGINGLRGSTGERRYVINVGQLKQLVGLTKITNTSKSEGIGNGSALDAITSMTSKKMAFTNVHYGSVRDDSPCLVEDSAHRIEPNDPLTGLMRCYSFYATKNMTTGSGGMFVTTSKEIYERARTFWKDGLSTSTHERQSGRAWDYGIKGLVSGYDGNDIAAAIGRVQLRKLPGFTRRRNQIRDEYNAALGQSWQGNHLYPYFVDSTDHVGSLIEHLREQGISAGYHYPGTGWLGVSLPIYPGLTDDEVSYVVQGVQSWKRPTKQSK